METVILADWLDARIERNATAPMYRQLLQLMQQAILTGELKPGTKLPSSRTLASDLAIGRNTVLHVYDQLTTEGYVLPTTGSGTFVADTRPETATTRAPIGAPASNTAGGTLNRRPISARGRWLIEHAGASQRQWGAFVPGVPDVSEFPSHQWSRLQARVWKEATPELLTYASGSGYRPLRRALADYLRIARSVRCNPDQVIITTGIHQSVDLAARLLTDVGNRAWIEDPCYWGIRNVLQGAGLKLAPIPVDHEGLNPQASDLAEPPHLVLVTPSHQSPLGMVMSLTRRRTLLEYARLHDCWIVEDDYDSEFRFDSRPLTSLHGLDDAGHVIYVGSLGKMLFPGLRVGYMVVPEHLVDTFRTGLSELYREGQLIQQAVLAEFIMSGYLTQHVKRMRLLYSERRQLLIASIRQHFGNDLPVMGDEAGLHLVLGLPRHCDDRAITQSAFDAGVNVRPLSSYYNTAGAAQPGLLLGYACVPNHEIAPAFDRLAAIVTDHLR